MPLAVLTDRPRVSARSTLAVTARTGILLAVSAITAILLHGYHPYVVDASIYVTGIQKSIDPGLFVRDSAFVSEHARLSAFSMVMAGLQKASGVQLDWLLLLTYASLVFVFLVICFALGYRIFGGQAGGWGASLLMTACMPIPVAATSLLLIDPYLTARSFSTPLTLAAILFGARNQWRFAIACCLLTAIFHPLMSVYAVAFLVIYRLLCRRQWKAIGAGCLSAFMLCVAVLLATRSTPVTASYREAVQSRVYYFPTTWHWYEIVGLLAPLALMGWAAGRAGLSTVLGRLALASLIVGATSCLCSFLLVRPSGPYLLARLQLLRSFHMIYALGIVMLGGAIATHLARSHRLAGICLLSVIAAGMLLMQRHVYASLQDVELPGHAMRNSYEQGFRWVRDNTPPNAYFAMDPRLADYEDEAVPGFRAMTRRSILTDVKDEGLASLFPPLAPLWDSNRRDEQVLESPGNQQPTEQLRRLGVSWVLLPQSVPTALSCPYLNAALKICRLSRP